MKALDFEKPILELEDKIAELKKFSEDSSVDLSAEINKLTRKLKEIKQEIYGNLTAWQRVQIARHPERPYTLDYVDMILDNYVELHGDRSFSDDKALVVGLGQFNGTKVAWLGHQKGRETKENIERNFGCAHPEGYRKALRIMKMAEKFSLPILIFIDTPGAYPGIGAEERGQAQVIATNLEEMMGIKTPILIYVIGEGGSGGALGVGVGDKVSMLENAYYSVISPEGCAAILWRDSKNAPEAAESLKLTAQELKQRGIIDEIIEEPLGGAHRDPKQMSRMLSKVIMSDLKNFSGIDNARMLKKRYDKFRSIGEFQEGWGLEEE